MLEKIGTLIISMAMALGAILGVHQTVQAPVPTIATTTVASDSIGSFAPAAGDTYRLKSSLGSTDTTVILSSFTEPVTGNKLTMDKLATDIAYGTLDPQSSTRKEFISFTGITQNSDGSATLTGVSRGLGFTSPYTASSSLRKAHPGQSIFILSDSPQLFNEYARKRADETITGSWSLPTPVSASNPATKAYVDSVVNGGAVTLDNISMAGNAGETIATGTVVFFDSAQQEWMKASAAVNASSTGVQLGIAQGHGTNGNAINGGVLVRGYDTTNKGGTAGQTIYLSNTKGATSTTAGTIPVVLGQMRNSAAFYFNPDYANYPELGGKNTFTATNTFSGPTVFTGDTSGVASTTLWATTTSGTWTKPAGLNYIVLELVGGGGAGGGENGSVHVGGGGGAAAYCRSVIKASSLPASVAITIGAGGIGDHDGGATGGSTIFRGFATSTGGVGGTGDASVSNGGAGGTCTGGQVSIHGAGGGAGTAGVSTSYNSIGGIGANSYFGGGGVGIGSTGSSYTGGSDATGYGSGGSGGSASNSATAVNGGSGKGGIVIVTEVF